MIIKIALATLVAASSLFGNGFSPLGLAYNDEWQFPAKEHRKNIYGLSLTLFEEQRENVYGLGIGLGGSHIDKTLTGAQISILGSGMNTVNGIQIGGVGSGANKVNGIQIGGLFSGSNNGRNEVNGIKIGGLLTVTRELHGIMVCGLFNIGGMSGNSYGLQMAGFGNFREFILTYGSPSYEFTGIQMASVINVADAITGAQISFFLNGTQNIKGIQMSGCFNVAEQHCAGLQIGIYNRAKTLKGVQIGVYNRAYSGSGVQIGLVNSFGRDDDRLILPLVNLRF